MVKKILLAKINIKINIKIASQVGICLGGHLPGRAGVWWTRLARPAVRGSTGEGPRCCHASSVFGARTRHFQPTTKCLWKLRQGSERTV